MQNKGKNSNKKVVILSSIIKNSSKNTSVIAYPTLLKRFLANALTSIHISKFINCFYIWHFINSYFNFSSLPNYNNILSNLDYAVIKKYKTANYHNFIRPITVKIP